MIAQQQTRPTEAHYGLLADIDRGLVFDQVMSDPVDRPAMIVGGVTQPIPSLVWDLEAFGWAWRPVDDVRWQLTDAGRAAWEASGL